MNPEEENTAFLKIISLDSRLMTEENYNSNWLLERINAAHSPHSFKVEWTLVVLVFSTVNPDLSHSKAMTTT